MKIEYTEAQFAALSRLYREQEAEYSRLEAKMNESLSEGSYVLAKNALEDSERVWQTMEGIKAAAEAIGIPSELLTATVTKGV